MGRSCIFNLFTTPQEQERGGQNSAWEGRDLAGEGHFAGGKDFFGEGGGQPVEREGGFYFLSEAAGKVPSVGKSPRRKNAFVL